MANQKISELNELLSPLSGDTLPIVNNGETKKITVSNLVSVSNVQPYFEATDTGSAQNYKVGDNVWLGDIGQQNTLLVKGIQESGSAYIKFGDSNGAHQHPYIGHDSNEDANVLQVVADTTKLSNALIVGSGSLVAGNPEMIHVYSSGSYNISYFVGNSDTYSQINVKNINSGSDASTDIVVTADNGTEQTHFIDLGINSSNYSAGIVGGPNDAYLLNVGNDLYVGTYGGDSGHSHLHLFSANDWENPQITLFEQKGVGFNTTGVTSGYTYEFSGSALFNHDLKVNGNIQGNSSVFLQPDINDSRYLEIYNTAPADIHIRGNAAYTFFGDDTNYVKIDSNNDTITINTNSGTTINNFIVLSSVSSSLDFANDSAAAAGGVPLGGLYRNGNFVMIRIS